METYKQGMTSPDPNDRGVAYDQLPEVRVLDFDTGRSQSLKSRISVVENVYFQLPSEQPTIAHSQFHRQIETDDTPSIRRAKATEEWRPLDRGWIEDAGQLCIQNLEGQFVQRIPTVEEQELAARRVLEIGWGNGDPAMRGEIVPLLILLPGESLRVQPLDISKMYIRCQFGDAKYMIVAFPK